MNAASPGRFYPAMADMMSKLRLPWYLTGKREAGMVSIVYTLLALAVTGLVV